MRYKYRGGFFLVRRGLSRYCVVCTGVCFFKGWVVSSLTRAFELIVLYVQLKAPVSW